MWVMSTYYLLLTTNYKLLITSQNFEKNSFLPYIYTETLK